MSSWSAGVGVLKFQGLLMLSVDALAASCCIVAAAPLRPSYKGTHTRVAHLFEASPSGRQMTDIDRSLAPTDATINGQSTKECMMYISFMSCRRAAHCA